jgi:hypothetical protein
MLAFTAPSCGAATGKASASAITEQRARVTTGEKRILNEFVKVKSKDQRSKLKNWKKLFEVK